LTLFIILALQLPKVAPLILCSGSATALTLEAPSHKVAFGIYPHRRFTERVRTHGEFSMVRMTSAPTLYGRVRSESEGFLQVPHSVSRSKIKQAKP
jgi:hypothetical protein